MKKDTLILAFLAVLSALLLVPTLQASVIIGPTLTDNISGWDNSGLQITALQNTNLYSVVFNNQGFADTVELRDSTNALITSVAIPASVPGARTVILNAPLQSGTTYRLTSVNSSNGRWTSYSSWPTANAAIRVDGTWGHGSLQTSFWFTFTHLTTDIKVAVISEGTGQDNSGYQATVDQLNDDTHFDFTATLVAPTDVDTLGELSAYNAVVIGDNGNPGSQDTIYAVALKAWVQAGGGVVMTGWGVYGSQATEINDIIPVNTQAAYGFTVNTLIPNGTVHPVTTGVSSFTPSDNTESSSGGADIGSTTLATTNGAATVVVASSGSGKSAYLGPLYSAHTGYNNADLRSGNADRLLEQAVAWVAGASSAPPSPRSPS